jgi:mycothiol synthase
MIDVRPAETDADLEAFIRIRRALLPNESGGTVSNMRGELASQPDLRYYVAELEGEVVGAGLVGPSDLRDRYTVKVRVLPEARRRGVGTAVLRQLAPHAKGDKLSTHVEEEGSQPFAERFGFREIDRQVEQVKRFDERFAPPALPDGIEVVSVAERPSLLREAYPLACQGYEDMALDGFAQISLDTWLRDEATLPEGSFVALSDGEIVGYSGLVRHDNEGVAEDGLTVVRRDWRRRGLARVLKELELAWASANGYREVVTWTQRGNEGMRKLNEALGYEYRDVSITMLASLPLHGL